MPRGRSPSLSPPPEAPSHPPPVVGHRAAQLQKVFTSAVRATLASNSYGNFSACFPTPATYCPTALEGVWRQLNTRLEEECLKDFEKICAERNVVEGLNELERVVDDAKLRKARADEEGSAVSRTEKPIYMLSANELYIAHIATAMMRAEKELKDKLNSVQVGNKEKINRIQQQRQEMQNLLGQMEDSVRDVEEAAQVLEQDQMRDEIMMDLSMPLEAGAKLTG